jgi:hypothetical protein
MAHALSLPLPHFPGSGRVFAENSDKMVKNSRRTPAVVALVYLKSPARLY